MTQEVILVDKNDKEIGTGEKMEVHQEGKLHRAFSIFVFNSQGQFLLQRRAKTKYHCAGLWGNTCCSHPRPGETLENAVHRKLKQEMGFDCDLKKKFSFIYRAEFDNGLIENEYDHVFIGKFDSKPDHNLEEVDAWKWISIDELKKDINKNPEEYVPWIKIILKNYSGYFLR